MKRIALLIASAAAAVLVGGCTTGSDTSTVRTAPPRPPTTTTTSAPAPPALATVPDDLVGKTLAEAKAELAKAGFTNIVVAGGDVTDEDKVESVSEAGMRLAPTAEVRVIGIPSAPEAPSDSLAACQVDATKCYLDGQQCQTGSCVNAARGLSPADVQRQTQEWLREHPGYCAVGETGAVAPCTGER